MKTEQNTQPNNIETEKCIICKRDTHVPVNLHIDLRDYYVEGMGQTCVHCYCKYTRE